MGIDRLSEWMGKFGYGHYTGIDLAEERSGNMPTREWKQKRFKTVVSGRYDSGGHRPWLLDSDADSDE